MYNGSQRGRVISIDGISPSLCCRECDVVILEPINLAKGEISYAIKPMYGRPSYKFCIDGGHYPVTGAIDNYKGLRRLTEREAYRLMGVSEENIDKILSADICRGAHYRLAGNSIIVDVLYYIFKQIFYPVRGKNRQLEIEF